MRSFAKQNENIFLYFVWTSPGGERVQREFDDTTFLRIFQKNVFFFIPADTTFHHCFSKLCAMEEQESRGKI